MSVEKTITIKIIGFDLDKERFDNIIKLLNTLNYKLKLNENPCYGYQNNDNNLRVNLLPHNKVEVIAFYSNSNDLLKIKEVIKTFLDNAILYFKAISVNFGRLYTCPVDIDYKYQTPCFEHENELKYKIHSEINSLEDGTTFINANLHFYNFKTIETYPIQEVIKNEILAKLQDYENKFAKSIGE